MQHTWRDGASKPRWHSGLAVVFGLVLALGMLVMLGLEASPTRAADAAVPGANVTITADGLSPAVITVTVGAVVTWHNESGEPVRLASAPFLSGQSLFLPLISRSGVRSAALLAPQSELTLAAPTWASGPIAAGGVYTHTYDQAGAFVYYASHAPGVTGKVTTLEAVPFSEMVQIATGSFQMGCDYSNAPDGRCPSDSPLHTVNLSAYWIDKYEVTNARYKACVDAGACIPPYEVRSETRPSYYGNPAFANFPVIYVDWYQAAAFCAWEGKRLPTEAEWERAARGALDTRLYPWGDAAPTCDLVNGSIDKSLCVGDTAAVGSRQLGASPDGVMDMAGNVHEWVNDWYQIGYYNVAPDTDPPGPEDGKYRSSRGGHWCSQVKILRTYERVWRSPSDYHNYRGFRCARSQ